MERFILNHVTQVFIFVFLCMGKMLYGPHGIFGCSNASAHRGNCSVASTQFSIYVHGSASEA